MPFPFEISFEELRADLDTCVDEVFDSLRSEFLTMPKGDGFVEYPVFEQGYETLKRVTEGFRRLIPDELTDSVYKVPITFVVLRAMLGFTPPEWAYVTSQRTGVQVPQGAARTLDRTVRLKPPIPLRTSGGVTAQRIRAMAETACQLMSEGATEAPGVLHRLDKADTKHGLTSLQPIADMGLPSQWCSMNGFSEDPLRDTGTVFPNWLEISWNQRSTPL